MTIYIETVELVEPWLYSVLSSDSALVSMVGGRIENTLGPLSDALILPKVIYSLNSSRDIRGNSGTIIDTLSMYDVKAIGVGSSWGVVKPIAIRIHQLIDLAQANLPGGGSLTCVRDSILQNPEVVSGQTYRHLGGTYRIRCSKD
jgi:hypothetical protein